MTTSYETDAVEKVCTYLILFIYYLNLLVLFYTLNTHNLNVLEFDLISIIINQRVNFRKKKNPTHGLRLGPNERFKI